MKHSLFLRLHKNFGAFALLFVCFTLVCLPGASGQTFSGTGTRSVLGSQTTALGLTYYGNAAPNVTPSAANWRTVVRFHVDTSAQVQWAFLGSTWKAQGVIRRVTPPPATATNGSATLDYRYAQWQADGDSTRYTYDFQEGCWSPLGVYRHDTIPTNVASGVGTGAVCYEFSPWLNTDNDSLYLYQDGTWLSVGTGSGGTAIDDGDYGDIDVSGSGTVWTIDTSAVTTIKIAADAVTSAKIGTGQVGADELASTAVTPGSYTAADITVDADGRITAAANGSASGVTDGDKGDIDVTSSGTVWTIDTSAVTWGKLAQAVKDSIQAGGGGGGSTELADGITILGDGSSGDKFRVDTTLIKPSRSRLDTIAATGLYANESVANYTFASVDSMKTMFTAADVSGQRGGWLANGTTGDSIAVAIPFGVVFGDSQAEGHPGLHGRLHPNGVNTFTATYPDSVGQLSYHLEQLTGFPWVNHGIGGQNTETCLRRFDRDVLALNSNPADGRGARTLNRRPYIVVIIAGINDVFGGSTWNPERTKANIIGMVRKAAGAGIKTVVLNLPGDENITTPAQDRYIEQVNDWLRGGALDEYGTVVVDYNTWWRDPVWFDNVHPNSLIVDDIHPSKVGYDSLANYIYRESMPRLHKIIVRSEVAPTGGITGFSRPTSVRIGETTTYALSGAVTALAPTAPITRDSVFFSILASTNVSGTSFSGFSHIQFVIEDRFPTKRVGNRLTWVEIKGETTSTIDYPFRVLNGANTPILSVGNDGSVWASGKTNRTGTTIFGQEVFGGTAVTNPTGGDNTVFGQYGMYNATTASSNSAFGTRTLFAITTGTANSAFGNRALDAVTTGGSNTATGNGAGGAVTTGNNNTFDGAGAGGAVTTGNDNIGEGESTLASCNTCSQNTAIGGTALFNQSGSTSNNTAIGYRAGFGVTTGGSNVFIGHNAGRFLANGSTLLQTPSTSVYIGQATKGSANGVSNENVFGYNATGNGSNTVTLGDATVTMHYLSGTGAVDIPLGTTAQRPTGVAGALRGNSTTLRPDYHNGTAWRQLLDLPDATPTTNHIPIWNGTAWTTGAVSVSAGSGGIYGGNGSIANNTTATLVANGFFRFVGANGTEVISMTDGTSGSGSAALYSTRLAYIYGGDSTALWGGAVQVKNPTYSLSGNLDLFEARNNGTNRFRFRAPANLSGDLDFILPSADGSNGHVLKTNGSGTLSFGADNNGLITALPSGDVTISTDNQLYIKGASTIPDSTSLETFTADPFFSGINMLRLTGKGTGGNAGYQSEYTFTDYGYKYNIAYNSNVTTDEVRNYIGTARGTRSNPLSTQQNDRLGGDYYIARKGSTWRKVAVIRAEVDSINGSGNPSARIIMGVDFDDSPETSNNWRFMADEWGTNSYIRHRVFGDVDVTGGLDLFETGGFTANKVRLVAPTLAADVTLTLPTNDGEVNGKLMTDGSGVLSWQTPSRAEISATATRHYTLTTAATNYTIDTLSSAFLTDFTYSAGVLTYTGTPTKRFLISYALSIATDDSVLLSAGVDKNGAGPLTSTRQAASIGTNAGHVATANISGGGLVGLSTNDTLKIVIQSDGAGAPIASVRHATLTVTPID